jgi:acetyl esterase/lipase
MLIKRNLAIIFIIMVCSNAYGQTAFPLYKGEIPNSKPSSMQEVTTPRPQGFDWVTGVTVPTLTYYPPSGIKNKLSPAVIICPGGGYAGLSIVKEGYQIAELFSKEGIAAFVLKNRLPSAEIMNDLPIGALQDVQQAFVLVKQNAVEWGIDTTKVGVMGFSAGGHLAASASTQFLRPVVGTHGINIRPDFSILIYPVISMEDSLTHSGSKENLIGKNASADLVNRFSNEKNVSGKTPPTFLVHAQDDGAVKVQNSLFYYEALTKNKISSQLLIYPRGGHGFGLDNPSTQDKWFLHCIRWLNDYVLKK